MLRWLTHRGSAKAEDAAREFLATLTGSAAAVLQQIVDWVTEQIEDGPPNPALLQLADARLAPVLAEIEAGMAARHLAGAGQKLLRVYCERFGRAYAQVACQLPAGHADRSGAILRATHLFSRACRLARMAHEEPDNPRREILRLFNEARQQGWATQRKPAYAGMPETSIAQEFAVALLWDTAPLDSLTFEQIQYLERFITTFGARIVLKTAPGATAPFAVLADGRVAAPGQADASAAQLFVGPGTLAGQMAGIAKLPDSDAMPAWAGTPLRHTDMQTLKALAMRMSVAWERKRIQRGSERQARRDNVRVAGGFDNIRRAVAYAAYVRAGGQLEAYDTRARVISERIREIMVGLEEEKKPRTPVEILAAMEAIGDSHAIESWVACDSSIRGYNLIVPGYRGWLAVGSLFALRESDQIDWHVAIVRRLHGAANARRAGIEILHGKPVPVGVGDEGRTVNVGLAELRDAILITGAAETHLITPFACTPGALYLVAGHQGRRQYRIVARSHGAADHAIHRCEPVDNP